MQRDGCESTFLTLTNHSGKKNGNEKEEANQDSDGGERPALMSEVL